MHRTYRDRLTESNGDDSDRQVDEGRGIAASAVASGAHIRSAGAARATADAAGKVAHVITDTSSSKRVPASKRQQSDFLRDEAAKTRVSTGANGKSGRRGQLKGHLFEDLDVEVHNAKYSRRGHVLKKRANPRQEAYDADRFVDGKYAGSVQHKSSAAGADAAVSKMEKKKPGSARKGTIRVPADQVQETKKRTRGRARVAGSDVTTAELEGTLDNGLYALAKDGSKAASKTRAAAKSAGKAGAMSATIGGATELGALMRGDVDAKTFARDRAQEAGEAAVATTVGAAVEKVGRASSGGRAVAQGATRTAVVTLTVSSLREVPALVRGDLSARDFAENRGVDAAEAATATALGTVASGALLATSGGAAASAAVGSAAAGIAASAATAAAGTGTAIGATAATALGGVTATVAGPVIVGGAVVVGAGFVVGKAFKAVRKRVRRNQQSRRDRSEQRRELPRAAEASPAELTHVRLTLNGSRVFTLEQEENSRSLLAYCDGSDQVARARATRQLRKMRFLLSDWTSAGERFGPAEFDALIAAGYISIEESVEADASEASA